MSSAAIKGKKLRQGLLHQPRHYPAIQLQSSKSFAKPLLALLGPRPTAEQLEQAFVMARTVWNAVLDGEEELMMARSYIKRSVPQLLPTIDDLIETKHRDYEDDRWRVAEISVGQAGGRLKVQIQVLVGV